jgi:KDO2-lipid IV(A) lauroyltransferase
MTDKRRGFGVWLAEVLLRPWSLLPLGFHYAMGRVLAWLLERVMHYRRDVVIVNLSRSFPEKKYAEIRRIAHDFYRHLGELAAEAVWFGGCRGKRGRARLLRSGIVKVANPEVLNAAFDRGMGTMLLMSHRGNWEIFGGFPFYEPSFKTTYDRMAVVYKVFSSRFWDRFIADNRCAPVIGLPGFTGYVESREILRYAVSHRRDNYTYMFNTDQFPYKGSLRYDVGEFLHQPTLAMGGAAALASRLGMTALYLRWERPARGEWRITLVPVAEDASATTPEEIMKQYYALLQADLQEDPARYLWSHKRWK